MVLLNPAALSNPGIAVFVNPDNCRADFTSDKVGMEYVELTAADRYVTAESSDNEPISSMKQPGEKCDLCACNPCQCGKMRKTGGTGNDPYEVRLGMCKAVV
jgi:hypothetical protein